MLLRVGLDRAWVDMARDASRVLCVKALPRRTMERSILGGLAMVEELGGGSIETWQRRCRWLFGKVVQRGDLIPVLRMAFG